MPHGHAFLCAVMDWYSRKVLGWALSNDMDVALLVEALTQGAGDGGVLPEIMNTTRAASSRRWNGSGNSRAARSRSAWMASGGGDFRRDRLQC
jgi:putative transposase